MGPANWLQPGLWSCAQMTLAQLQKANNAFLHTISTWLYVLWRSPKLWWKCLIKICPISEIQPLPQWFHKLSERVRGHIGETQLISQHVCVWSNSPRIILWTRWYTQLLFSFFFLNGVQSFSIRLMIRMCRQHRILQKYPLRQSLHVFALAAFALLVALRPGFFTPERVIIVYDGYIELLMGMIFTQHRQGGSVEFRICERMGTPNFDGLLMFTVFVSSQLAFSD